MYLLDPNALHHHTFSSCSYAIFCLCSVSPCPQLVGSQLTISVALWDKGLFGLNWPNQVGDSNTNWNNNEPVNPLREADGFSISQWFGHGLKDFPPGAGDFMELPAGGRYTGDVQCNRAGSRLRDPAITRPLPEYACDVSCHLFSPRQVLTIRLKDHCMS